MEGRTATETIESNQSNQSITCCHESKAAKRAQTWMFDGQTVDSGAAVRCCCHKTATVSLL
jgi:hypothetical protein